MPRRAQSSTVETGVCSSRATSRAVSTSSAVSRRRGGAPIAQALARRELIAVQPMSDPVVRRRARSPCVRDTARLPSDLAPKLGDVELEAQLFNGIARRVVEQLPPADESAHVLKVRGVIPPSLLQPAQLTLIAAAQRDDLAPHLSVRRIAGFSSD